MIRLIACTFLLLLLATGTVCPAATPPLPVLGDYNSEPRLPNGHVDNALLLERLQELHANTYFWLIWHKPTDWDDLQTFLPLAQEAGIQVWAYLVPFSESGFGGMYSEPYRTDFVKWAQEIGKLSLKHPNLVGYVIDDFWANVRPGRFTPEGMKAFVDAGKAVNPKLKFYPLMYFGEINERFTDMMAPLADGVVAAYHQDTAEIEKALTWLDDDFSLPAACWTVFPANTGSKPGDFSEITQEATITNASTATASFSYYDNFDGPTSGYRVMQMRVDNQMVWSEDIAGMDHKRVLVNLREFVGNRPRVRVSLGVYDYKGVSQFPVKVAFYGLRGTGLKLNNPNLGYVPGWQLQSRGAFRMECQPERRGRHAFKLPLIVMPAGSRSEYARRYQDEPDAVNIARRAREALLLAKARKIEGVVTYCLDKKADNPDLSAIARLYQEFGK